MSRASAEIVEAGCQWRLVASLVAQTPHELSDGVTWVPLSRETSWRRWPSARCPDLVGSVAMGGSTAARSLDPDGACTGRHDVFPGLTYVSRRAEAELKVFGVVDRSRCTRSV